MGIKTEDEMLAKAQKTIEALKANYPDEYKEDIEKLESLVEQLLWFKEEF